QRCWKNFPSQLNHSSSITFGLARFCRLIFARVQFLPFLDMHMYLSSTYKHITYVFVCVDAKISFLLAAKCTSSQNFCPILLCWKNQCSFYPYVNLSIPTKSKRFFVTQNVER